MSTWSDAVKVAAQTAVLGEIDADSPSPAYLEIYDVGDVKLAVLPFQAVSGTVNAAGVLTMLFGDRDEVPSAAGTASYATLKAGLGTIIATDIECVEGSSPVLGYVVMSSLAVATNTPVEGISFTIG